MRSIHRLFKLNILGSFLCGALLWALASPGFAQNEGQGASDAASGDKGEAAQDLKLREFEEKILDLKEKVFQSKTKLTLLKERLLSDVVSEARVIIQHENDMGGDFRPVRVLYHLDGQRIYFQDDDSPFLAENESFEIANHNMAPGNHTLSVEMVYQGDSSLFSYIKGYEFELKANYTFYASRGKITKVTSVGYLQDNVTYDLRDRPSIKFKIKQDSYTASTMASPKEDAGASQGDGGPRNSIQ